MSSLSTFVVMIGKYFASFISDPEFIRPNTNTNIQCEGTKVPIISTVNLYFLRFVSSNKCSTFWTCMVDILHCAARNASTTNTSTHAK